MLMFLFFFALWLLFNGRVTWDVIGFGLVLSALVTVFAVKICGWSTARSRKTLRIGWQLLCYAGCLVVEIVKANLATLKVILSPKASQVLPQIFRFDSRLHKNYLQTILANSITITPGTYTIGIDGSVLTVHALNTEFAEGTPGSDLNLRLVAMDRRLDGAGETEQEVGA